LKKIKDYVYGCKITLSNLFVASQVNETGLMTIDNSSDSISLLSSAASLIPVVGSYFESGINSVWEFYNERKVKREAKKMLNVFTMELNFRRK